MYGPILYLGFPNWMCVFSWHMHRMLLCWRESCQDVVLLPAKIDEKRQQFCSKYKEFLFINKSQHGEYNTFCKVF